jgi:hypothetical protein
VELKEEKVGRRKDVVEAVQEERNVNTFMVIQSHENHHAIIDQHDEILGYRYRIKPELLKTLKETTAALPPAKVNAGNRADYLIRHYSVWRDYKVIPYASAEYRRKLPALKEWCDKIRNSSITYLRGFG